MCERGGNVCQFNRDRDGGNIERGKMLETAVTSRFQRRQNKAAMQKNQKTTTQRPIVQKTKKNIKFSEVDT